MSDPAMTPPPLPPKPEPVVPVTSAPPAVAARRVALPWRVVWATAAVVLLIVAWMFSFFLMPPGREPTGAHASPVRFTLTLPGDTTMPDGAQFAVSPDGTQVVVAVRGRNRQQRLWLRRLQSLEWRELSQTDEASFPFWSLDSRHVGFFADRSLKRIDLTSGLTQTVCDAVSGRGGAWSGANVIVFADSSGLSRVPAAGGAPVRLTKVDGGRNQRAHLWPQFLPDGRRFTFLVQTLKGSETHMGQVDTAGSTLIEGVQSPATFVANGLLFPRGATLALQAFDSGQGSLTGDAQTLAGVDGIAGDLDTGPEFSASTSVLLYRRRSGQRRTLTWFDRQGLHIATIGEPTGVESFSVSPDGRRVAVARRHDDNEGSSIWLMDTGSDRVSRLTVGRERHAFPVWSPDGTRLAFIARHDDGTESIATVVTERMDKEEELFRSPEPTRVTDWSRDGRFVIYTARSPGSGTDVMALPINGDRKPQPLAQTPARESQGRVSPDGRLIAYVSDESGVDEVYVRPFPEPSGKWQISTTGGSHPRWSGNGQELYFLSSDGLVMAVDVRPTLPMDYRAPRPLFEMQASEFEVTPDGRRFLGLLPLDDRSQQIEVVLNWFSELTR
jgi:Tol biopolymer transport system component